MFNGAGVFVVRACILNLQYKLYEACPAKTTSGFLCKRKLSEQRLCSSCGHIAKNPIDAVLFLLELQDVMDKECRQTTTMFTNCGEKFIGRKASEMRMMELDGDGEGKKTPIGEVKQVACHNMIGSYHPYLYQLLKPTLMMMVKNRKPKEDRHEAYRRKNKLKLGKQRRPADV
ncbi:hypothetical protein niasHT_005041 [Heterodera trifolii]|uniref:Uncharacterized protein n=1 Tax=Heterodera trifolii TaxID=157864 RepID=A0ABD2MEB4_9BILA